MKPKDSDKLSTGKRIEQALLTEISVGKLEPGQRLDEAGLAERFGTSRTPVREALSRLTAQGVLVEGEKRGVFVAEYSREELSQIFEAMHEIEAACARIVSLRLNFLSRSEIEAAQIVCEDAAASGDTARFIQANEDFHMAIYRATGNPFMAEIASEFRRRTGPFRAKKFATHEDLLASAQSHRDLMADIFSRDSATASKGMRDHMTLSFMETLKAN
ncbi:GntR family transcriptional regulator [Pseudooctadecabacter jejudonensis]|uniref:HTH-type transcriptional regulator McbR n=1 Tax=Pseudooctadecabacter jejudonensis TaxID=1391910 RepID=A0A1Y5SMN2_9RHOB|nr:GntR family transcriptional regulator [Pseudooctadecabacter jejudonensis]SLN41157.1 HTH-type transcriptional regulator McbR [Pseudooctadecabacter jejudonensis]